MTRSRDHRRRRRTAGRWLRRAVRGAGDGALDGAILAGMLGALAGLARLIARAWLVKSPDPVGLPLYAFAEMAQGAILWGATGAVLGLPVGSAAWFLRGRFRRRAAGALAGALVAGSCGFLYGRFWVDLSWPDDFTRTWVETVLGLTVGALAGGFCADSVGCDARGRRTRWRRFWR